MPRPSLRGAWRSAAALAAAACLAATAAVPAHAEGQDPTLPAPPTAGSVDQSADGFDALLAHPRDGAAANYVGDEPRPPAASSRSGIQSAEATGSISGWVFALSTDGFTVGMASAQVSALSLDPATNKYVTVATATSAYGGAYTIEGLPDGSYLVLFAPPSYSTSYYLPEFWEDAPIAAWATEVVVTGGGPTQGVDERLEPLLAGYLAGEDRYETSAVISSAGFAPGVPCVYVASGTNFPDALSAGPAASACGGPLLLVPPTFVPEVIAAELDRLDPKEIVIAGGPVAVSGEVESILRSYAPAVRRIAGVDRYDTSRKLVEDAFDTAAAVWVATGANFPDALSASGAASAAYLPVLIVPGYDGTLDVASTTAVERLAPETIAIAGGTSVVSTGVENALSSLAPTVRFGGADRYETGLLINRAVWDVESGAWSVYAFLTNGEKFPDALSGAPVAGGLLGAPLYVVPPTCTPDDVQEHITDLGVHDAFLLGYFSEISLVEPFKHC